MRSTEPVPAGQHPNGRSETTREATLRDVARMVGVAPRTVSRVINDEGGFSEKTRVRVLEAVEELGYRPNMLARGLKTSRSGTIALIGGDITNPTFGTLAEGIQRRTREAGRTMILASTGNDPERQAEILKSMWGHAVEGLIVFPTIDSIDQVVDHARRGMPTVVVGDTATGPNLASVRSDFESGARAGVRHLLSTGRRRIGMIGATISPPWTLQLRSREHGFLAAVAEAESAIVGPVRVPPTIEGAAAALEELLVQQPRPDAIFAYTDLMAVGVMRAAERRGLRVPEDLAVVGVGDTELGGLVTPALTSIRLDCPGLADAATNGLDALIETPGHRPEPVILPVELVVRQST